VARFAYMKLDGEGGRGVSVQPTVGVSLGRLSTLQLRIEAGFFYNTFGTREDASPENPDPSVRHGRGAFFDIGVAR
jgi:hypothetical protein